MDSVKISNNVLQWYDVNRRTLPWRYAPGLTADPYRVWLSEIMLQQTQVDTVIPYFNRFINKWPTIQDLAAATLDDILYMWQGLGYYARARNLHRCAQIVVKEFQEKFPSTPDELMKLPGIGPYVSAAIAAIAFDYPATVIDGNIARIVSRIFGFHTPIKHNQKQIRLAAQSLTPSKRSGDYAQALMDIGSDICTPRSPKCSQCPMIMECKAYASGNPLEFPGMNVKKETPIRYAVAFISIHNNQILLRKRNHQRMLHGLWELPGSEWDIDSLPELPTPNFGVYVDIKHTFSHFHLITRVQLSDTIPEAYLNKSEVLCNLNSLSQLALSTLTKKILMKAGVKLSLKQPELSF